MVLHLERIHTIPPSHLFSFQIGSNADMQDIIRDNKDENSNTAFQGRLLPDVYADARLIFQPPAVGAIIMLFNRNHNWIAENLVGSSKDPR